ncbi:Patched family protein [Natrinema sp. CBA1119]|uniref:efflux RND transporter permease subunit n=1 Tax=Natrinema sp. CBA1119 TaxID=1608465 RepID=UPI000BF454AA|nr:MMPL family transporter [Natrinema sp. CBA1119]PGF13975.1 Patched family protein [Natrinema sp. CBA1119]
MSWIDRFSETIMAHSRAVIAIMLVLTVFMGAGAGMIEQSSSLDQFQSDSTEAQKLSYVEENFTTGQENTTSAQVIVKGENVLSQESMVEQLRLQQSFRENETINRTLVDEQPTVGAANLVALASLSGGQQAAQENGTNQQQATQENDSNQQQAAQEAPASPTLQDQIDALESMNATEYERALGAVLSEDSDGQMSGLAFMPTNYETGSTSANATMLLVTHQSEGDGGQGGTASDALVDAQLAMQSIANDNVEASGSEVIVFGGGIMGEEINNSMVDSLAIVGPLALLFVVVALIVAYRDVLDILLGLFGIAAVLVWTFGFMGWAGIDFNQMFIAVPVLLIGLSIDYAIHIFMRHREQRQHGGAYGNDDARGSMRVALAGVGIALVLVTATTAIGFLSNLTSPVPPIQDFGVVSAVGITVALLVFGTLVPALKAELDEFLENRGYDRKKRAFGTGGGRFSQALSVGSTAARRIPIVIILIAALVSAGGAYGATQVDTSFNQEDFIAEDPPEWTKNLPEPFKPGDYSMKENLEFVNQNFVREDSQAQILIEGNVTDPETLQRVSDAENETADSDVAVTLSSGEADVQSPLRTMQRVAAENESFNATFTAADTDGDGVPDRNLEQVYDELFEVAPDEAAAVIHRTDDGEGSTVDDSSTGGDYEAVRMVISTSGTAAMSDVTTEMRSIADGIDGSGLEATATGQTILFDIVQKQLMDTVIQSLLITLVAVFAFLMVSYRIREGSATLGAVTLLPVVFSVSWILGTMYLLEIPFNVMTGMITSLTVGLGVAYSIHMSERYSLELKRTGSVWEAMSRTVTGTGGALLGSAATTVGGFGVLAFAILPPLQQFGIITGLTIIYAFLASVLVLPSLLVVWTKYLGPDVSFQAPSSDSTAPAASDGGRIEKSETEPARSSDSDDL